MKNKNAVNFEEENLEFNLDKDLKNLSIEELEKCEELLHVIEKIVEEN